MVMLLSADVRLISIHALREEGDVSAWIFQPARRYFYPRPPRGGRQPTDGREGVYRKISIHALREEGDPVRADLGVGDQNFYPRPPRGGRLLCALDQLADQRISIHALREEGDLSER